MINMNEKIIAPLRIAIQKQQIAAEMWIALQKELKIVMMDSYARFQKTEMYKRAITAMLVENK